MSEQVRWEQLNRYEKQILKQAYDNPNRVIHIGSAYAKDLQEKGLFVREDVNSYAVSAYGCDVYERAHPPVLPKSASAPASEQAEAGAGEDWNVHPTERELVAYGDGYEAGMKDGAKDAQATIASLQVQLSTEQAMRALSDERGNDFEAECARLQAELAAANERAAALERAIAQLIDAVVPKATMSETRRLEYIEDRFGGDMLHAYWAAAAALKPAASQDAGEG
jgi:hypothetical protein